MAACWIPITKHYSLASLVCTSNMAAVSLYFRCPGKILMRTLWCNVTNLDTVTGIYTVTLSTDQHIVTIPRNLCRRISFCATGKYSGLALVKHEAFGTGMEWRSRWWPKKEWCQQQWWIYQWCDSQLIWTPRYYESFSWSRRNLCHTCIFPVKNVNIVVFVWVESFRHRTTPSRIERFWLDEMDLHGFWLV